MSPNRELRVEPLTLTCEAEVSGGRMIRESDEALKQQGDKWGAGFDEQQAAEEPAIAGLY
jgi:hypothetical protein